MSEVGRDDHAGEAPAGPPDESALWLSGDDFENPEATATDGLAIRPTEETPPRPPGPGLPESLVWMGGMFGAQLLGGVLAVVAVTLLYLVNTGSTGRPGRDVNSPLSEQTLSLIQREYAGVSFGIIQTVTVLAAAAAVCVRLGRERSRRLPLTAIPWRHVALLGAALLPLVVVSSQLHVCGGWAWDQVTEVIPSLKRIDEVSSIAFVEKMARQTSFLGMLLMVAVAPAIAEELVFRGAIGRGLIARWGLPAGVLITSILFAAMHVHPPHVVALLPLAIFMHVAYIATRSFWAPVLIHFLNNAFAVLVLFAMMELPEAARQLEQSPRVSVLLLGSSGFCVAMLIASLWKSRVQFFDWERGTEWTPGYPAVEHPPEELRLEPTCRPTTFADWAPAVIGLAVFVTGVTVFLALAGLGWHV